MDPETARDLELPLKERELETSIYKFKKYKSPGEDGITAEWYQTFWPLIKKGIYFSYQRNFKRKQLVFVSV